MSRRFLFSFLGVVALACVVFCPFNAVLATCPKTKPYQVQCLQSVSVCAGVQPPCTNAKEQQSASGLFGCNSNGENNTDCYDGTTYALCYKEYQCVPVGLICTPGGTQTGTTNKLLKIKAICP